MMHQGSGALLGEGSTVPTPGLALLRSLLKELPKPQVGAPLPVFVFERPHD